MMVQENRPQTASSTDRQASSREAGCLYALITGRRSVSRRNRAAWYLRHLNKTIRDDQIGATEEEDVNLDESGRPSPELKEDGEQPSQETEVTDISLVSVTDFQDSSERSACSTSDQPHVVLDTQQSKQQFLVTPNTRALFLSRSIATSIILDLSPSMVSVSSHNDCVFLDSMFDALKRVLHLLVKTHEIPTSAGGEPYVLSPKVFVSVIAYTPFVVAKNNQVLVQNRRIASHNIEQVLVEIWICLNRLTQEIHELVSNTCGVGLDFESSKSTGSVFVFPQPINGGIIRHPGAVLEDIYELGLFSSSLMPRLSRLSMIVISDGLFASTNCLDTFRLKSIAISFVSLGGATPTPDACFGYTPYGDLMKFISKTTLGVCLSHRELIDSSHNLSRCKQISLLANPLHRLFSWTLHSEISDDLSSATPRATNFRALDEFNGANPMEFDIDHISRFFCVDQPISSTTSSTGDRSIAGGPNYHDWRSFRQLDRNLDADFEQVLACLLREGYLIKNIHFKRKETSRIVARLILHWRHNLDLEQELTASYWTSADPFDLNDTNQLLMRPSSKPIYGDTYCEIFVHGSYSFLHNLYCDRRTKRRTEYRDLSYRQFRQLIDGVLQTHERLQYLSRFYRDSSLSKVPSFLLHGNSLLYEQPHTHRLTSTIENVNEGAKTSEFQEYWQKVSCLDTKNWTNLMHIHTLRLVLEHDQPKHKNIHYQNANGRYTQVQCRRAFSAILNFIKGYASFSLLEDTTYIKFIYNNDDDLRQIETSATKGFIVIRINRLLPILVIHLMFTSGILDSHRVQIVNYLEDELINCKLRNTKTSTTGISDNILKSKTIAPSSESCCVLIRSPLERMLKFYNRSFISEYLIHNWSHGLPGSCPYGNPQHSSNKQVTNNGHDQNGHLKSRADAKDQSDGNTSAADNVIARYNLVFGKYLYGVRIIQTISNLPNEIVPLLAANVLSKISAILVNVRIRQGFHIAFNSAGILNLVAELAMRDKSNEGHSSSCLCQYVAFPPVVNSTNPMQSVLVNPISGTTCNNNLNTGGSSGSNNANLGATGNSRPGSLSGSLANSDSYMKSAGQDTNTAGESLTRNETGDIKVIKEYWIEQQYGISSSSEGYHSSLQHKRYSEIVDHLFITDTSVFECLLTYDLLQLLCDKLSPFYDLDSSLARETPKVTPMFSPTMSISSPSIHERHQQSVNSGPTLPSAFIEGNTKDGNSKVPLLELEYKFSVVKFLDYCQQANLNVLLFRDRSEFYEHPAVVSDPITEPKLEFTRYKSYSETNTLPVGDHPSSLGRPSGQPTRSPHPRKMSVDVNDSDSTTGHLKREHRSSYQHDTLNQASYTTYLNPLCGHSLNHMFLETLHKRLKQMHDKELQLSDYDRRRLAVYLRRRMQSSAHDAPTPTSARESPYSPTPSGRRLDLLAEISDSEDDLARDETDGYSGNATGNNRASIDQAPIDWRLFLRKGNQENLMMVLVPASLDDVSKWLHFIGDADSSSKADPVCPMFVFRCSSSMISDHVLPFLHSDSHVDLATRSGLESDLWLHFGQPCKYLGELQTYNDELSAEILPLIRFKALNQSTSDEKTLEIVHFRAFLRKIKNTVLKSRFSSLNDAYLSEMFVHKDDILYYIDNVDPDTQKKYHVSSQLKSLAEFIKNYEDFYDSLPKEPGKPCNQLLNSILLQKCGLFINQPIARFNESNPLIKQLHDRKLLFLMRCNYKIELPILEENLASSSLLRGFIKTNGSSSVQATSSLSASASAANPSSMGTTNVQLTGWNTNSPLVGLSSSINEASIMSLQQGGPTTAASSLGKSEGSRLMDMKCGSMGAVVGAAGSPSATFGDRQPRVITAPRFSGSSSTLNSLASQSANEGIFLEAFKGLKSCSIREVKLSALDDPNDISLRHEAHMAEVLRRTCKQRESHHYRRVLKSKANYNQSHSAIYQALKRVDSLGRLEHFCLTPLLFSPTWRSKLAPVRDHTLESNRSPRDSDAHYEGSLRKVSDAASTNLEGVSGAPTDPGKVANEANDANRHPSGSTSTPVNDPVQQACALQQEADERWHQMVCNNYIKEYEQYIKTLGFNSVQIRYQSASKNSGAPKAPGSAVKSASAKKRNSVQSSMSSFSSFKNNMPTSGSQQQQQQPPQQQQNKLPASDSSNQLRKGSISTSTGSLPASGASGTIYNTGYLIKFLNSGCLVFKVGFCKPYVYSILYSIEGERFNNTNIKMNMTAFLDELDNIKVTMHLHSFTYDYHLRSMYSYISGRQLTFSPGYHLISFLDDFRKYYQKAPNYARNHILCGDISVSNLRVSGQQLYNYIVTHNSAYNMDVLEMTSSISNFLANLSSLTFIGDQRQDMSNFIDSASLAGVEANLPRNHANDYVLIELKREKVRYRDGKDPDIFDCALLITNDVQQTNSNKNCLALKYFLLLTNQRDLYPKLVHTYDNIISLGCHRPIRLGITQQLRQSRQQQPQQPPVHKLSTATAPSSGHSDPEDAQSSELQSSGEVSGPHSIISIANSVQSSNSGLQFGSSALLLDNPPPPPANQLDHQFTKLHQPTTSTKGLQSNASQTLPKITVDQTEDAADALHSSLESSLEGQRPIRESLSAPRQDLASDNLASSVDDNSQLGDSSPLTRRKRTSSSSSSRKNAPAGAPQERTICDEEITYLGYFSSDEMDMLKFLQEKTANLRSHIEQVVRKAEVHYRRDYLWHKLMQRTTTSNKSDDVPLTIDELIQLFTIVEAIDLAALDPQLSVFTSMHINWYLKLLKAFTDLKQSTTNLHRVYLVKASKQLLLYIDPKCTTAFILLTVDPERGSVELNMLLKDRQECTRTSEKTPTKMSAGDQSASAASSSALELDQDCQQMVSDFINFCAAFMWSTFLI